MRRLAVTLTVLALALPAGAAHACEQDGLDHGPGGGPAFGSFGMSRLAKAIQGATAKHARDVPPAEPGVLAAEAPIPGTQPPPAAQTAQVPAKPAAPEPEPAPDRAADRPR